jgi:hypothetical protein
MRDDLLDESPVVKEALRRLPENLQDERVFRIVRAGYLCLKKDVLPKEQWTKLEDVSLFVKNDSVKYLISNFIISNLNYFICKYKLLTCNQIYVHIINF